MLRPQVLQNSFYLSCNYVLSARLFHHDQPQSTSLKNDNFNATSETVPTDLKAENTVSYDDNENSPVTPIIRRSWTARGQNLPKAGSWNFNPDTISFNEDSYDGQKPENSTIGKFVNCSPDDYEVRKKDIDDYSEMEFSPDSFDANEDSFSYDIKYEKRSTITPTEKSAFRKIFKNIFEEKQLSQNISRYGGSFATEVENYKMENDRKEANKELNQIISESVHIQREKAEEMFRKLEQYPASIRESAAEALGINNLIYEDETEFEDLPIRRVISKNMPVSTPFGDPKYLNEQKQKKEREERLETLRETERGRVEALMQASNTDFELWKVLEAEVFSLIPRLGLEDVRKSVTLKPTVDNKKKKKQKKSSNRNPNQSLVPVKVNPPDALANKHNVSPLELYGPLYPSYLLLGLRMLDRSFSRPSPLALALLPQIKSLGYISRVLGASTQFYNELLLIYRFRQNDFTGMLSLLEEMELSSLLMNQETLDIIVQLCKVQDRVRQGSQGNGISTLWALPKFARGRFGPWRDYLREKLEARQKKFRLPRLGPIPMEHSFGETCKTMRISGN